MATVAVIGSRVAQGAHIWTWASITEADTGGPITPDLGAITFSDKTVQMTGTWGAGTIILEGSNDGVTYSQLTDAQGNAISMTANGIETILENPAYIRPRATAGAGMDVKVVIAGRAIMQLR